MGEKEPAGVCALKGGLPEGAPGWRTWGPSHQESEVSLCWAPPPPPHSMMEVGVPGRSPAGQASLPREQEAEPRPADLLLEVRGQGRPSRPHFLQPRPTPCGPRVYGNSGLDGFSEIIRSLCPRLTPRAHKERDPGPASWEMWEGKGTLLRGPRSGLSPKIFFLNWSFTHQDRGSAFRLHNLLLGDRLYFTEE